MINKDPKAGDVVTTPRGGTRTVLNVVRVETAGFGRDDLSIKFQYPSGKVGYCNRNMWFQWLNKR